MSTKPREQPDWSLYVDWKGGVEDHWYCVPIAANAAGQTSSTIFPMTTRPPSTSLAATLTVGAGAAEEEEEEEPDATSATSEASSVTGW